jgi:hypothetical protein
MTVGGNAAARRLFAHVGRQLPGTCRPEIGTGLAQNMPAFSRYIQNS